METLKKTIRKGLPLNLGSDLSSLLSYPINPRSILYKIIIDLPALQNHVCKNQKKESGDAVYKHLLSFTSETTHKDIMKDMVRCGTPNPDFQNEGNPLYNILTAVSNYMPEIGYGQGMNFIGNLSLFALIN